MKLQAGYVGGLVWNGCALSACRYGIKVQTEGDTKRLGRILTLGWPCKFSFLVPSLPLYSEAAGGHEKASLASARAYALLGMC